MKKNFGLLVTLLCTALLATLIGCGSVGQSNTESGLTASTSGERTTATGQPTTASKAMISNLNPKKKTEEKPVDPRQ